jgi:hypothetical protein
MSCDNVGRIPKPDIRCRMRCRWCRGLMAKEPLYDYVENDGQLYAAAWTWVYRCGTCAKVVSAMGMRTKG